MSNGDSQEYAERFSGQIKFVVFLFVIVPIVVLAF